MKTTKLNNDELESIVGGDFAYDVGRAIRFVIVGGGGFFPDFAIADYAATQAINQARAEK
jgi:hypothetical protein